MVALWNLDWVALVALGLILSTCCFLAVLWSRRPWNERKIRIGVFWERQYKGDQIDPTLEDTKEWPQRREE